METQIEMKPIKKAKTLKSAMLQANKPKQTGQCPPSVQTAVQSIITKMNQSKLSQLHPPFMPKTLSKFRHQYFYPLKKEYQGKLVENNEMDFKQGLNFLRQFIERLDSEYFEIYLQQIREPYIKKMFNQNYEFDKIDFKQINSQYKIRTQIQNLLNAASQWLIQIEATQDILQRIELYFDIKVPILIEKAKKEGVEMGSKRKWFQSFFSMVRNVSSFALRKSSKIVQSSFFTAIAPAAAMLTLAVIGGKTFSLKPAANANLLIGPLMAITIPYLLDGLASSIERKQYMEVLQEWATHLEQIGLNISKFNQQLQETIFLCACSKEYTQYSKHKLNLQKYVNTLSSNISSLTAFNEEYLEEMRERTEAYFTKYQQRKEGEWTIVIPDEQSLL